MINMNSCPWITLSESEAEKFFRELTSVVEVTELGKTLEFLVKWFVDSSSTNAFQEIESDVLEEKRGGLPNPLCCSFSESWVLENLNDSHFDEISKFVSFLNEFTLKFGEELDDYEHGFLDLNDEQVLQYRLWDHIKITFICFEKSILSLMDIPKPPICRGLFKLGKDFDWKIDALLKKQIGLINAILVHQESRVRTENFHDYFGDFTDEDKKYSVVVEQKVHFHLLCKSKVVCPINLETVSDSEFSLMASIEEDDPTAVLILSRDYLRLLEKSGGVLSFVQKLGKLHSGVDDNGQPKLFFANKGFSPSTSNSKQRTTVIFNHLIYLLLKLLSVSLENDSQSFLNDKEIKALSGDKNTVDSKDYLHNSFTSKKKVLKIEGKGTAPKELHFEPNTSFLILSLSPSKSSPS